MIPHPGITEEERIYLYKITIANSDIAAALFTTRLFMKTVKDMKDEGFLYLQDSIVVSYARPFKRSRPYGSLEKKWATFNDPAMQTMHNQIIEQRDKLVAHSDADFRRVEIVPEGSSNIPNSKQVGVGITISNKKFQVNTFPLIERLCMNLGSRLSKEMFNTLERLYGKMNLPSEPFDLLM